MMTAWALARLVSFVVAGAAIAAVQPAGAQQPREAGPRDSDLPSLARCNAPSRPVLPKRWRAVALMTPAAHRQLDLAELTFDASLPAMRATIYGVESGMADLLVTGSDTYRLSGPRHAPNACVSLGRLFAPPSRQWLPPESQCEGRAPVLSTSADWWKLPAANGRADWIWFRNDNGLPLRMLRTSPGDEPAVIGNYAMTSFMSFESVPQTNLAALVRFCRAQPGQASSGGPRSDGAPGLRPDTPGGDGERVRGIVRLAPGLSHRACGAVKPVNWPERFRLTAIMLSTDFAQGAYPTEAYYDWSGAKALLTRLRDPRNPSSPPALDGLLSGEGGYHITRDGAGATRCEAAYPPVVRPDWMSNAKCLCRGVLAKGSPFARGKAVRIHSCPVGPSSSFWAWYDSDDRPLAFQSTAIAPAGLMLADYDRWSPLADIPAGVLDVPAECKRGTGPLGLIPNRAPDFGAGCAGCHISPGEGSSR